MRAAALFVGLLAVGAARAEDRPLWRWEQPKAWEAVPLVAAVGLIWLDVAETRAALGSGRSELNPLIGPHPSTGRLVLMGGVLPTLGLAVTWFALPYGWRIVPCGAVIGAEFPILIWGTRL